MKNWALKETLIQYIRMDLRQMLATIDKMRPECKHIPFIHRIVYDACNSFFFSNDEVSIRYIALLS